MSGGEAGPVKAPYKSPGLAAHRGIWVVRLIKTLEGRLPRCLASQRPKLLRFLNTEKYAGEPHIYHSSLLSSFAQFFRHYWNKCKYKILCSNLNGMTNLRLQNTNLKLYCLNSQQELTEIKLNMRACFVKSVGIWKHRSRQNSRIYCLTLYEKKA